MRGHLNLMILLVMVIVISSMAGQTADAVRREQQIEADKREKQELQDQKEIDSMIREVRYERLRMEKRLEQEIDRYDSGRFE